MSKPTPKRGVLYIVWGKGSSKERDAALQRAIRSVYKHHPGLGMKVHEPAGAKGATGLLEKSRMYDASPFEETVYLDIDTVVMGKLDYGFEQAARHHIAVSICESPYARRYHKMLDGDVVEYNTGVLFFRKSPEAERVFREWERVAFSEDSSHPFPQEGGRIARMECNDQASFAKAVHTLGFNPFVLPCNWNFRPRWNRFFFGPLKVWHDYLEPPAALEEASMQMQKPEEMRFIQVQ